MPYWFKFFFFLFISLFNFSPKEQKQVGYKAPITSGFISDYYSDSESEWFLEEKDIPSFIQDFFQFDAFNDECTRRIRTSIAEPKFYSTDHDWSLSWFPIRIDIHASFTNYIPHFLIKENLLQSGWFSFLFRLTLF